MKLKRLIFLSICLIMIITSTVLPTVSALGSGEPDYDYSRPGSYFNTTVTAADVIEHLGYTVSDAEREYLNAYCDFKIHYDRVTSQNIRVTVVDGSTQVEATPYTYTARGGESVTWIPVSATLDGGSDTPFAPSSDIYVADFGAVTTDLNSAVSVKYRVLSPFTVSADELNSFLNLAFDNAADIKSKLDTYNSFYTANEQAILKYYSDCELYEQYLDEKFIYDQKLGQYNDYLAEYQRYENNLALYNKYLTDLDEYLRIKENNDSFDANMQKYNAELEKYNKYLADLALMKEQVDNLHDGLMGKITYYDSYRQLHACFFSNLVNKVVDKKDMLNKFVEQKAIDDCANASARIREIFKPAVGKAYTDLKTQEEKYEFYKNNYEPLRDSILDLTRALHYIYSVDLVRIGIRDVATAPPYNEEDYTERLAIFIAQLIYFANALSDQPVMTYKGKDVLDVNTVLQYRDKAGVDHKKSAADILGAEKNFVKDTGRATPISVVEVKEPTKPVLETLPPEPTQVSKPAEPIKVQHPGDAPAVVTLPTAPVGMPTAPDWLEFRENEIYKSLALAYEGGAITERPEASAPLEYTPETTVSKNISAEMVTVTFVDMNGNILETVEVDKNTAATFSKTLPTKKEDISATYVFAAWVTVDGEEYDLSSVSADVTLYPSFTPVYKEYGTVGQYLDVNLGDTDLSVLPLAHFTDLAKADRLNLRVTAKNATVELSYSALNDLMTEGVSYLKVNVDTSKAAAYTCKVTAHSESGVQIDAVPSVSVSVPCADATFGQDCVLTEINTDKPLSKNYNAGVLKFFVSLNKQYLISVKYSITFNGNLIGKVTAPTEAMPGDTVNLGINIPLGMEAELYYTLLTDNSKHTISGSSFVMPAGNVHLGAKLTELIYTVKFVSDGKVISEKQYKYGDTVIIPNPPTKVDDGTYNYRFASWSPTVLETVTADANYEAQFEKTLIPVKEDGFSMFNFIFYTAITVFSLGIVTLVLFILNKKKVISIKGMFRAIGGLFKKKTKNSSDTSQTSENTVSDGEKEEENKG